jgi:hypothetical protein
MKGATMSQVKSCEKPEQYAIAKASCVRKAEGMELQLSKHAPVIKFLNACRKKSFARSN